MAKKLYSFKAYITLDEKRDATNFHDILLNAVDEVCVHEVGHLEGSVWKQIDDEDSDPQFVGVSACWCGWEDQGICRKYDLPPDEFCVKEAKEVK